LSWHSNYEFGLHNCFLLLFSYPIQLQNRFIRGLVATYCWLYQLITCVLIQKFFYRQKF
jgi:hypothetical protein